jgi:deoxyribodipyrimidine photo-lyase
MGGGRGIRRLVISRRRNVTAPKLDIDAAARFGRATSLPRHALQETIRIRLPSTTEPASPQTADHEAVRGGRAAALTRLSDIDPIAYARTRNHVGGAVTGLSPWIRHGVLSLAEVRDVALARAALPSHAEKLVSELAWRAYWREVHAILGDGIRTDIETPIAVPRGRPFGTAVPNDVLTGTTGMRCIDDFVHRLHTTGLLHNHERMWLASWLVHVRGVRWQAGADWFLRHLLDGDPASNHLSWQWIAGTFSARPYLFHRQNLETFTDGVHCSPCPLLGHCDLEGSVEAIAERFLEPSATTRTGVSPLRRGPADPFHPPSRIGPRRPLVWVGLDSASANGPAMVAFPEAPRLFVVDPAWLDSERPSPARLVFLFECLADVPELLIVVGDPADMITAAVRQLGCDGVAVAATPCPRMRSAVAFLATVMPVAVVDWPRFCSLDQVDDLRRFSRFWSRVRHSAMRPTPSEA